VRIEDFPLRNVSTPGAGLSPGASPPAHGAGAGTGEMDRAGLSLLAQAVAGCGPQRLESLRQAVSSRTYQVPAAALSRRMIDYYLG